MSTQETENYDVVLLCEDALSQLDAQQIVSLHDELRAEGTEVAYTVLLPVDDAAAKVEAAMTSLAAGEVMASPALAMSDVDLEEVRRECRERSEASLAESLTQLRAFVSSATGRVITGQPIDALAEVVKEIDAREAIILTQPHVVAEFFHLDWTSRARRKIGVPVLHLLERETFAEQGQSGV